MVMIPATAVHFDIQSVKKSATTRIACGVKVANQAAASPLYQNAEIKSAVDATNKDTVSAQAALDDYNKAHGLFVKARTALGLVLSTWDASFDILVAAGQKNCATTNDAASLGMPVVVGGKAKYVLTLPVSVLLSVDLKKSQLVSHVQRAKGMRATRTDMSPDPISATSWKELDGDGLVHRIPLPAPGLYWFRAAHKRAHGISDFTVPVSILVK